MSAIAHYLEQQGLTTVVIGLVHLHLEKIKPPRSLWVPFELGRPIGPPLDKDFQRDVLMNALSLTEQDATAGAITDYPKDDPNATDDPHWVTPSESAGVSIVSEVASLQPAYNAARRRFGRTSVGVAKTVFDALARFVDDTVQGKSPATLRSDISTTLFLRLALDDLKAYYLESASSEGAASSRQLNEWYWHTTYAGQQIAQLRQRLLDGPDGKLKSLAEKFVVPRAFQPDS